MASPFQDIYDTAGGGQQLDPLFLQAQTIVESRENPKAKSPAGAVGISQFMPPTAAKAGVGGTAIDPRDPEQAIPAQAAMMNGLIKKYTAKDGTFDVNTALKEYHGGPNRAIWGAKTAQYPVLVANEYKKLKSQTQTQQPAATPAFDEFLKQKAQEKAPSASISPTSPPATATPAFDSFLKQKEQEAQTPATAVGSVGTKPFGIEPPSRPDERAPQPASAPAPAPAPVPSAIFGSAVPSPFQPKTGPDAIDAVIGAGVRGYQATPPLLTPGAQTFVDAKLGLPGYLATRGANALLAGAAGGYNALQEAAKQTITGVTGSPRLGRDVAAGMDLIPAMRMESRFAGPHAPNAPPVNEANLLSPQFKAKPFSEMYNPEARAAGASEPNYFSVPKEMTPTANPAAPQTRRFAEALYQGIVSGATIGGTAIGHDLGGIGGAAVGGSIGAALGHVTAQYGGKVGAAVGKLVTESIKESSSGVLGEADRQSRNKLQSPIP